MIYIICCISATIAWFVCQALRAPIGFQTDRGFFYGIPDQQEADRQRAAERFRAALDGDECSGWADLDQIHTERNRHGS